MTNIPVQSPYDLQFGYSVSNRINQPLSRLVRNEDLTIAGYSVVFTIIGESHLVEVSDRTGKLVFTEILACVDLVSESLESIHCFQDKQGLTVEDGSYNFSLSFEKGWVKPDFNKTHIYFDFPNPFGDHSEDLGNNNGRPYTYVQWTYLPEITQLTWSTIHVYPIESEETVSVVSTSKLTLK